MHGNLGLTLSQTSPGFYVSAIQVFLKGEIAHIKQFYHSVFYPYGKLSAILIKFEIVSANSSCLEGYKICHLGKG